MRARDAGRHLYRIFSCATVLLHINIRLPGLHRTHSIPGGTLSVAVAVIGAAALMIYSKWAWRTKKNRWQEEAGSRQHDEVETATRKTEREKAKKGLPWS